MSRPVLSIVLLTLSFCLSTCCVCAQDSILPVQSVLQKPIDLEYNDAALIDVVEDLRTTLQINILLDEKSLDANGLATDEIINFRLSGVACKRCLELLLHSVDLTFVVEGEVIFITTPEEAENRLVVRTYDVTTLAIVDDQQSRDPLAAPGTRYDVDAIEQMLMALVDPDSWDEVGGPASAEAVGTKLIVRQTAAAQEDVQRFLTIMTQLTKATRRGNQYLQNHAIQVRKDAAGVAKTQKLLAINSGFEFVDATLLEVVQSLEEVVQVYVDERALDDIGLGLDTTVNLRATHIPLANGLRRILDQHDLGFVVEDGFVRITTKEYLLDELHLRVYPVADLLQAKTGGDETQQLDDLVEAITSTIAPDSWDIVGGPGIVEPHVGSLSLMVCTTVPVQRVVEDLLIMLRNKQQSQAAPSQPRKRGLTFFAPKILDPRASGESPFGPDPFAEQNGEDPFAEPNEEDPFAEDKGGKTKGKGKKKPRKEPAPASTDTPEDPFGSGAPVGGNDPFGGGGASDVGQDPFGTPADAPEQPKPKRKAQRKKGDEANKSKTGGAFVVEDQRVRGNSKQAAKKANQTYSRRVYFVAPSLRRHYEPPTGERWFPGSSIVPVVGQKENAQSPQHVLSQAGGAVPNTGWHKPADKKEKPQPEDPDVPAEQLAEVIQELIAPESWKRDETYIRALPGRLIVRQTVENHRQAIYLLIDLGVFRGVDVRAAHRGTGPLETSRETFGGTPGGLFNTPARPR